jgi:hypothetical protein
MSEANASYPSAPWDGTSKTRTTDDVNLASQSPDGQDWDQLTAEVIAAQEQIDANLATGTWTRVGALTGSWTGTVQYLKNPNGDVSLRGVGTAGTLTGGTTVFTIPSGARPAQAITVPVCPDSGGTGDANMRVKIGTDGTVKVYGLSATTTIDFGSVHFNVGA